LTDVIAQGERTTWTNALGEVGQKLRSAAPGSVALIASARQCNEELFLLKKLADKVGALTDSIPRTDVGDHLLLSADRNPNSRAAALMGLSAAPVGSRIASIAEGIRNGTIKTLIVFGEDVTRHGIGEDLLGRLETLVVCDILPGGTTRRAHYLLPGCAHVESTAASPTGKGGFSDFSRPASLPAARGQNGNSSMSWFSPSPGKMDL
jgi:NADH-quinone oxidoreductase subunit G